MSDLRIPRILHYCSFGRDGKGAKLDEALLLSWKKYCPDYEIMCWSEDNFDVDCCPYVSGAYARHKYAFVADVARLWALNNFGGIYLDTDVELTGPLDDFLVHELFLGYESNDRVSTAIIGATKGNKIISDLLSEYSTLSFVGEDGKEDLTTNVQRVSDYLTRVGFSLNGVFINKDNVAIYPQEYFSPKDFVTGRINRTDKTHAIHYYSASWKSSEEILRDNLYFKNKRFMPQKLAWNLASYVSVMKHRGIVQGHRDMFKLLSGKKK